MGDGLVPQGRHGRHPLIVQWAAEAAAGSMTTSPMKRGWRSWIEQAALPSTHEATNRWLEQQGLIVELHHCRGINETRGKGLAAGRLFFIRLPSLPPRSTCPFASSPCAPAPASFLVTAVMTTHHAHGALAVALLASHISNMVLCGVNGCRRYMTGANMKS